MALRAGEKSYFTFIKGLNTEASPFTFPENSSYDEVNFELLPNGARRRRLGLDYESGYTLKDITSIPIDSTLQAITQYNWKSAGGNSSINFKVVQTGRYIRFYSDSDVLSGGLHSTVIDMSNYKVSSATQTQQNAEPLSMVSGKGYLFIVGLYSEPIYLSYDILSNTITVTTFLCKTREFDRIHDGLEITANPTTLSSEHQFNLYNQGWTSTSISAFFTAKGYYPSNTQIMSNGWLVASGTGARTFSAGEVANYALGNTPAPNGSLLTNIFDTTKIYSSFNTSSMTSITYNGASTITITTPVAHNVLAGATIQIEGNSYLYTIITGYAYGTLNGSHTVTTVPSPTTLTITITPLVGYITYFHITSYGTLVLSSFVNPQGMAEQYRVTTAAFYAGRLWISGSTSARLSSRLYFSQILDAEYNIGYFFQSADPTSEEDSALVDTDGGYITIPDLGKIVKMEVFGTRLLLFSTNGVWTISGDAGESFKATSFSLKKIIDISVTSPRSIVVIDSSVLAFSKQGIYQFSEDPTSGTIVAKSISQDTIQTLFSEIPENSLTEVVGLYDDVYKRVFWMYSSDSTYTRRHNKILVLDVRLGAWYKYTIPSTANIYICGGAVVRTATTKDKKVKFFTVDNQNSKITWSDFTNTSWKDFYTRDTTGTDAAAYLLTGHELEGDVMRKKQVPYLFTYFKRSETQWVSSGTYSATLTPPSSCMCQFWWDFADSTAGNKIGTAFQAYKFNRLYIAPDSLPATFDPGYTIVTTKHKIRGVGKAFQIKFYTESGKDCYIYGWATTFTGYTEV